MRILFFKHAIPMAILKITGFPPSATWEGKFPRHLVAFSVEIEPSIPQILLTAILVLTSTTTLLSLTYTIQQNLSFRHRIIEYRATLSMYIIIPVCDATTSQVALYNADSRHK